MRLNVGMTLELGLNLGLATYNLDLYLGTFQLRYHFQDLKENEKVTQQIKLHCRRPINRLVFLGLLQTQQAWKGERRACGLSNNILEKSSLKLSSLSSQNAYRSTNSCCSCTWATKSFSLALQGIYIAWLRTIKLVVCSCLSSSVPVEAALFL